MEKIGLVKAIEGDMAIVEIKRYRTRRRRLAPIPVDVRVKNSVNASVGQYVKLHYENRKFIKSIFLAYMIPFFSMIIGFMAGFYLSNYLGYEKQQELIIAGTGFLFLAISYLALRAIEKKIKDREDMQIVISHIID